MLFFVLKLNRHMIDICIAIRADLLTISYYPFTKSEHL